MIPLFPAFYIVLLLGTVFLGLVLLAAGFVLLLKLKNKLPGGLAVAFGAVFTAVPVLIFLALNITRVVRG